MNSGKCDSCKYTGPLYAFRNDFVQPEVRFNLCPQCMRKAVMSVRIFLRTPAGRKALAEKMARKN